MRAIFFIFAVFINFNFVLAQDREFKLILPIRDPINQSLETDHTKKFTAVKFAPQQHSEREQAATLRALDLRPALAPEQVGQRKAAAATFDEAIEDTAIDVTEIEENVDFQWRPALIQSGLFLAIQHGYRMTEEKTRRELDGPFFRDWKDSVDQLHGWYDGGRLFTNYVAHPMQGSMTARIFINNSPKANAAEFGRDRAYWASRTKAFVWALAWSTQFEIGPLSEASLGNIGKQLYDGHKSKLTYGDIVVTPIAGIAWTVGEDAMDKFVLRNWLELKIENRLLMKILRSLLTPTRSFANVLRGRAPWRRDHRKN